MLGPGKYRFARYLEKSMHFLPGVTHLRVKPPEGEKTPWKLFLSVMLDELQKSAVLTEQGTPKMAQV